MALWIMSVGSLLGMVGVLVYYDHRELDKLESGGLPPNSIVSLLATVSRSCFVIALGSCLIRNNGCASVARLSRK